MAQGKPFTEAEKLSVIESLRPFLEAGLSRNKACDAIGFDPTTLSKWVQDSEVLSMKLRGWENTLNILAMANVADALNKEAESDDTRKETSKWWLERRMKAEFSTRIEQTGEDGAPIVWQEQKTYLGNETINKTNTSS